MKNIVFVASECVPFVKTGGLADVVGALPKNLNPKEYDVRVILPNYTCIPWEFRGKFRYVHHFYMDLGNRQKKEHVGIMTCEQDGITYYLIDNEFYFSGWKPYGSIRFDIEKFTFFSKAALAILPVIGFHPDIIHCHDWQTALVPVFLRTLYHDNSFFWKTKVVLTIHNLKFQGIWDVKTFRDLTGFPDEVFTSSKMEYHRDANMLKAGIVYCDYLTTVSHTYAQEIQTPYFGEGLDGVIRSYQNKLRGIVNGIDYDVYNPSTDPVIFARYSLDNVVSEKRKNKQGLQKLLGLPQDDNKMMIAIISRLTDQKGLDLIDWVMNGLVDRNIQLVIVGTGDTNYENMFKRYQSLHPDRISVNLQYSEDLAHKTYAAADAILMPSRFEPCGLTQLIALRYGSVPIVRETGGLKDTVQSYNEFEGTGTGFSFTNYNADDMLYVINYAKHIYYDYPEKWNEIVKRGMQADFSWKKLAGEYDTLYRELIG